MKQTVLIIIGLLVAMLPACAQGDRQLVRQGNQLYRQGNYPQAELCYRKAIAAQPANGTAHYNLGCALQKQKKDQQALAQYKQAAKTISGPKRQSQAYYNMGTVLQGQKEYAKAMEAYKNALRMNPQNERARYNYVQCKRLLKQQQQQQKNQKQNKNQKNKNKNKDKKKDQNKQQCGHAEGAGDAAAAETSHAPTQQEKAGQKLVRTIQDRYEAIDTDMYALHGSRLPLRPTGTGGGSKPCDGG